MSSLQTTVIQELIRSYFLLGLQQLEIRTSLASLHNIHISERHLKRLLNRLGLYRKKYFSDLFEVANFLESELRCYGQLHGYRWMHLKCIQNNLVVSQEIVRNLLQILDPHGVSIRTRRRLRRRAYINKGPNYLWHIDCYDKLKPYGICISGCIDGFSRYIVWLKAAKNTNNPKIIAGFYITVIESIGGCPLRLRADMGTENRYVEQMQLFLRQRPSIHDIGSRLSAFFYGTSPANQRIESFWAILRKHHSQFWINFFLQIKDEGLFNGTFIDKALLQFCFLRIIQNELDVLAVEWNTHRISASKNSENCKGRPYIMYEMPEAYDTHDYICRASNQLIQACKEECIFIEEQTPCDEDVHELALIIMQEKGLRYPENPYEAANLYGILRREFYEWLQLSS